MSISVLLSCNNLSKSFGAQPLFDKLNLTLHERDHVGLVGPNGAGKSTLLKVLFGTEDVDNGTRLVRKGACFGYVPQDPTFPPGKTVYEVLDEAIPSAESQQQHERLKRIEIALGTAGFVDSSVQTKVLSGGWRKRLAIVRELISNPDILLLDEPTNHLDLEGILWLEKLLQGETRAFIVVSHDRYFLQNVATRMIEIDRVYAEGLLHVSGNYTDFLEKRDSILQHQANYQATLANIARREINWLRRGPKARTTKSKSRIQSAEGLVKELEESHVRSVVSSVGINFNASNRKTKRLWTGTGLCKCLGKTKIVDGLDLELTRGTRLGLVGANGSGKTTLLRILVGELEPDDGSLKIADGLQTAYFEQVRKKLAPELTLRRALAPQGDTIIYRNCPIHVASWAARFLFRNEQLDMRISKLSGGERARIHLARLMIRPVDLIVLDEPTNDLDIPTLSILEQSLLEFSGALVLVTHDRYLLDRVTTKVLALDGHGGTEIYANYEQWISARCSQNRSKKQQTKKIFTNTSRAKSKKLTYLEKREWDAMEENVIAAEVALEQAKLKLEDPTISSNEVALVERYNELEAAQTELDRLYNRWVELESKIP